MKTRAISLHLKICFLFVTVNGFSQSVSPSDSVNIKSNVEGFYSWYINLSATQLSKEFNPTFERRDDGMTQLNFSNYKKVLAGFRFTKEGIQKRIDNYKACSESLAKISFDKFSRLHDLDEFEAIHCDFGNRYEWTGGMEQKDRAELSDLKRIDKKTISGQVIFYTNGKADGGATITFKKEGNNWMIDDVK